jgi:O-methyltransferase
MINWGKRVILQSLDAAGYRLLKRTEHERLLSIAPQPEPALSAQAPVNEALPALAFERRLIDDTPSTAPTECSRFLEELGASCNLLPMRLLALYSAARYLTDIGIDGDVVDCGYGATATLVALATAFRLFGDMSRRLILFDTTADPLHRADTELELWGTDRDLLSGSGSSPRRQKPEPAPAEITATGYPAENVSVRRYPRELIVPSGPVALLGLTSETYDSNRAAIANFFPLLCRGGVIAVEGNAFDTAGRDAVGEYFKSQGINLFFVQVATNYRIGAKT